jgi:hypothetical protein
LHEAGLQGVACEGEENARVGHWVTVVVSIAKKTLRAIQMNGHGVLQCGTGAGGKVPLKSFHETSTAWYRGYGGAGNHRDVASGFAHARGPG